MLLEPPQKWVEKLILKRGALLKAFKKEFLLRDCCREFSIDSEDWFEKIRVLEISLSTRFPDLVDKVEPVRGIAILLRNLSFLLLAGGAYLLASRVQWVVSTYLLLLAVVLLVTSAVASFYFHTHIVLWGYLSLHKDKEKSPSQLMRKVFLEMVED